MASNGAKDQSNAPSGGNRRIPAYSHTQQTKFLEKTTGHLWVSDDYVVKQIYQASAAILQTREALRRSNTTNVDSSAGADLRHNAEAGAAASTPKDPKWHQTEFGKELAVLAHIQAKVAQSSDKTDKDDWKNVYGSVGAAISRGRRFKPDPIADSAIRKTLDEVNLAEEVTPSDLISAVGRLFQPDDRAHLDAEAIAQLKTDRKAAKEEKKNAKKKTVTSSPA